MKNFEKNWKFKLRDGYFRRLQYKNNSLDGYIGIGFNDTDWRTVDIPHDWGYELGYDPEFCGIHGHTRVSKIDEIADPRKVPQGDDEPIGWYRKKVFVPEDLKEKLVYLEFDGVYRDCDVWVNSAYMGHHASGYTSFRYEISDDLEYGKENIIAVRVDASQIEGWWYEGAGIYRNVRWIEKPRVSVKPDSVIVRSDIDGQVAVQCTIINQTDTTVRVPVRFVVGDIVCERTAEIKAWGEKEVSEYLQIENPILWDLENPHLYTLKLEAGDDVMEQTFGIRKIEFFGNDGFHLNGRRVQLQGVCVHQDLGCVGVALTDDLQEYKIRKLKEAMGANAYRCSHHAPAPALLDACDRLGMLVMDETRMLGSSPAVMEQLEDLILRDRNHPCVILWSIGNEEWNVDRTDRGHKIAKKMMRKVRELDPTRPIIYSGNNAGAWKGINELVDVRGFNYLHCLDSDKKAFVAPYHEAHPQQPILGSEEASGLYGRNQTVTSFEDPKTVSSYDDDVTPWGSTAEGWLKYYNDHPYVAGGFMWTGFDYTGETIPHASNTITSFGVIDLCGYPKEVAHYYRSWWTQDDVLFIFPRWDHTIGERIKVVANTNCEEVELFINGRSQGRKTLEYLGHLEWDVIFEPGELKAVGYRGGVEIMTDIRRTPGPTATLKLRLENTPSKQGTALVTAETFDAEGNPTMENGRMVHFRCEGGAIKGVGNGDPASYEENIYLPVKVVKLLDHWTADGEAYDVNTPTDGVLYENKEDFNSRVAYVPEMPFRDVVRADMQKIMPPEETVTYQCGFDAEAGEYILNFQRVDGDFEVWLDGSLFVAKKRDSYSQAFEMTLTGGAHQLEVKVTAPQGMGGIHHGVELIHFEEPDWRRKTYGGVCMAAVDLQSEGVKVTAWMDGSDEVAVIEI